MKEFSLDVASPRTPAAVRSALLAPETWETMGAGAVETDASGLTATMPFDASKLPEPARRAAGESATLRTRVEVPADGPARLHITVPGAPAEVRVELTARAGGAGASRTGDAGAAGSTMLTAHAAISSSVPLMGALVESALEPVVRRKLTEQLHQIAHFG